jgi:hypothetical protein
MSKMTLSMEFEPKVALRLARYEVQTGRSLAELLDVAVQEWERTQGLVTLSVPDERRLPVEWNYTPRGGRRSWLSKGWYYPEPNRLEIERSDAPSVIGVYESPSAASIAVVRAVKPEITPNRNGLRDWNEIGTGRKLAFLK